MPLFSVIIPTYNRAGKVVRAVESVFAQTCQDFDLWVVDDGADDTEGALKRFDERLHYFRGGGAGVAAARNAAVAASGGRYVAFLDADDWWFPDKLQQTADAVSEYPNAGLFYSSAVYVNQSGVPLWTPHVLDVRGRGYPALVAGNFVALSAAVLKREYFDLVGGFDTKLTGCEDWDLWIRIARRCEICLIRSALTAYEYLSEDSFSSRYMHWLAAHDEVVEKAFGDDPALSESFRRRARSGMAYAKGRICMAARNDSKALSEFRSAVALRPFHWRALIYLGLLSVPWARRLLPRRLKLGLRLPEAYA